MLIIYICMHFCAYFSEAESTFVLIYTIFACLDAYDDDDRNECLCCSLDDKVGIEVPRK